jgi:hypothetical protein
MCSSAFANVSKAAFSYYLHQKFYNLAAGFKMRVTTTCFFPGNFAGYIIEAPA